MQIIKAKFLKEDTPHGKAYTYFAADEIQVGDTVMLNETAKGIVVEIGVPESEIESFRDKVRTAILVETKQDKQYREFVELCSLYNTSVAVFIRLFSHWSSFDSKQRKKIIESEI